MDFFFFSIVGGGQIGKFMSNVLKYDESENSSSCVYGVLSFQFVVEEKVGVLGNCLEFGLLFLNGSDKIN